MELKPARLGDIAPTYPINPPVYNGAGTLKKIEDVTRVAESNAGCVTVGSLTAPMRPGNHPGQVFWIGPHNSINSLGVPNPGEEYYAPHMPEMARICHGHGKSLIASTMGESPEEFGVISELVFEWGADGEEINLACPNKWKGGEQGAIYGFYPDLISEILFKVKVRCGTAKKHILKMPPYSNPKDLQKVARAVADFSYMIAAVVVCNTIPNAFCVERKPGVPPRPAITFGQGFGGYAGVGYKAIALGQSIMWQAELTDSDIQVIGVGGISKGEDAADYFQFAKVSAVQVVTGLFREYELNPAVFDSILIELDAIPELPQTLPVS